MDLLSKVFLREREILWEKSSFAIVLGGMVVKRTVSLLPSVRRSVAIKLQGTFMLVTVR